MGHTKQLVGIVDEEQTLIFERSPPMKKKVKKHFVSKK